MDKLRFIVLVASALLLGCGSEKGPTKTGKKAVWTEATKAVFASATKVEVFLLDGQNSRFSGSPMKEGEQRIGSYLITTQGPNQGREFANKLAGLLSNDQLYTNNYAQCFWPGAAFRVWTDHECVEVLICFHCRNFYCGPPTMPQVENASFSGSRLFPQLIDLAKEAFPDDKEIQALKE